MYTHNDLHTFEYYFLSYAKKNLTFFPLETNLFSSRSVETTHHPKQLFQYLDQREGGRGSEGWKEKTQNT